jgi:hypothetical protein
VSVVNPACIPRCRQHPAGRYARPRGRRACDGLLITAVVPGWRCLSSGPPPSPAPAHLPALIPPRKVSGVGRDWPVGDEVRLSAAELLSAPVAR